MRPEIQWKSEFRCQSKRSKRRFNLTVIKKVSLYDDFMIQVLSACQICLMWSSKLMLFYMIFNRQNENKERFHYLLTNVQTRSPYPPKTLTIRDAF